MHMPHSITENYPSVLKTSEKLVQDLRREPTSKEIGRELGKSPQEVETIFEAMSSEKSISHYDHPSDFGSAEQVPDPKANTEGIVTNVLVHELISKANLDEDSRKILKRRFYDEWSQAKISKELGVSQMQVSRLERRALKKMREIWGTQDSE